MYSLIFEIFDSTTSWWFQPIWKILVKTESLPQVGVKIKNIWNHHLDYLISFISGSFKPTSPGQGIPGRCRRPTNQPDKFTGTDFSKPNKTRSYRNHQRCWRSPKNSGLCWGRWAWKTNQNPTRGSIGCPPSFPVPETHKISHRKIAWVGKLATFILGGPRNAYFFRSATANAVSLREGFISTTYVFWNIFASSGSKDPKTDSFATKNRGHQSIYKSE